MKTRKNILTLGTLTLLIALLWSPPLWAQVLTIDTSAANFSLIGEGEATVPGDGSITSCFEDEFPTQGYLGYDLEVFCGARARAVDAENNIATSGLFHWTRIEGLGQATITLIWDHGTSNWANVNQDVSYSSTATNRFLTNIPIVITGGVPGQRYTLSWRYLTRAVGATMHEAGGEDPIRAVNTLSLNGVDQLNGALNLNSLGLVEVADTGSQQVISGASFVIGISSILNSNIAENGKLHTPPFLEPREKDRAGQLYYGILQVTLVPLNSLPPLADDNSGVVYGESDLGGEGSSLPEGHFEFSLDIGSDREWSDPIMDGDEVFDPGDAYVLGGNGVKDDALIFGFDPPPTPQIAGSEAPVGSGLSPSAVQTDYFDIDGMDNVSVPLQLILKGDDLHIIGKYADPCIHPARHIFISHDDDVHLHYTFSDPNGLGSVPVNSLSPFTGQTYGQTSNQDEIIEQGYTGFLHSPIFSAFGLANERDVHQDLDTNPDLKEIEDDDVDALDIDLESECEAHYFSVDHEATFHINGTPLYPGFIYEYGVGSNPVAVITPFRYLGIGNALDANDDGVPDSDTEIDIDAFEFVWIFSNEDDFRGQALALLFSVDDDDPLTPEDETGGLDPSVIYGSFLNGTYFIYSDDPTDDDVDAITAWRSTLDDLFGNNNGLRQSQEETPGSGDVDIVSIDEASDQQLAVYPNPLRDQATIQFVAKGKTTIELIDVSGRCMTTLFDKEVSEQEVSLRINLDASVYEGGIFLIKMTNNKGSFIQKIIIE